MKTILTTLYGTLYLDFELRSHYTYNNATFIIYNTMVWYIDFYFVIFINVYRMKWFIKKAQNEKEIINEN